MLDEHATKNYLFPTYYAGVTCSVGIFLCDYYAALSIMPDRRMKTPMTGTTTTLDVGNNIYSVRDGRLLPARTRFRGTAAVTKHLAQLFCKGGMPDTECLEIGVGSTAELLRRLDIEKRPFQFRFAKSMNACFDLPDPEFA